MQFKFKTKISDTNKISLKWINGKKFKIKGVYANYLWEVGEKLKCSKL